MDKTKQFFIGVSVPLLLAICILILDNQLEVNNSTTTISFAIDDWTPRSGYPDLGGKSLVSEILRYFVLLLTLTPLWIAFLLELREKPIERIELDLT